jgi:hypothetical protein
VGLHHAAHAAAVVVAVAGVSLLLFWEVCDETFGGEEEAGDGSGVLEGAAGDLGWVDDAGGDEVFELACGDVVAFATFAVFDVFDDESAFDAGVRGERAEGSFDGAADDVCAGGFVTFELEAVEGLLSAEESGTAAGDDAFFDGSAGGVEGVFDAGLLFLHFGFGGGTDVDDGDAAGELGEALLEFFAVIVRGGFLDLALELGDAALDGVFFAGAFDDDGIFLFDDDAFGATELGDFDGFEFEAEVFGDALAAGEDGDVFEHGLAAVAEAWGFDGDGVEGAAEFVDHECGEGFTFDVFGDDEEWFAGLGDLFEEWEHVLEIGHLFLVDEDVGVVEGGGHGLWVRDEVRGEVAFIELHAFDDVEGGFDGFGFFDGDGAVLADLVHGVGDDSADFLVPVSGDGGDLSDLLGVLDWLGDFGEFGDEALGGLHDAVLEVGGVGACGDVAEAFFVDGFCEDGGGGGTVTGHVAGLAGDLADELSAHVFEGAGQFDFLGDGDAVLGDGRGAEFLVEDDVTAGGPESGFDGLGDFFDAAQEGLAGGFIEAELFCHNRIDSVSSGFGE